MTGTKIAGLIFCAIAGGVVTQTTGLYSVLPLILGQIGMVMLLSR